MKLKIVHTVVLVSLLGYIRPSRELLEYYRTKVAEYDSEYDALIKKLDKYRSAYEDMVRRNN